MLVVYFFIPRGGKKPPFVHAVNVGTIGAVNDDAAAAGRYSDDFIAGNGRAAAREPNEKSGLSVYEHAARRAASAVPACTSNGLGISRL